MSLFHGILWPCWSFAFSQDNDTLPKTDKAELFEKFSTQISQHIIRHLQTRQVIRILL